MDKFKIQSREICHPGLSRGGAVDGTVAPSTLVTTDGLGSHPRASKPPSHQPTTSTQPPPNRPPSTPTKPMGWKACDSPTFRCLNAVSLNISVLTMCKTLHIFRYHTKLWSGELGKRGNIWVVKEGERLMLRSRVEGWQRSTFERNRTEAGARWREPI